MIISTIFLILILDFALGLQSGNDSPANSLSAMILRAKETKVAIPLIGVHDALSARIILDQKENSPSSFKDISLFVSGFGVSASRLGQPDAGILTRSDMEDASRNVILSVPRGTPVIVDGDTGYGGSSNVRQTIRRAAAIGAAAISIEDQHFPKRCTYVAGRGVNVVDREEAIRRVRTALAAQKEALEQDGNQIMVIARTDCRMGIDFQEAMARCQAFEQLGADIVYAENLQSNEEYIQLRRSISKPMILAQVQTGTDVENLRTVQEIGEMGFELALWGVSGLQAYVLAMASAASELLEQGGMVSSTRLATLEDVKRIVGFDELDEFDSRHPCV
jgi:2-methylisocitrate lyase-like PEP mutase family enzyme